MKRRRRLPRFPLEPALRLVGEVPEELTAGDIARIADVHPRQAQRWLADGGLTHRMADRLATHLRLHPIEVWGPEAYYEA